MASARARARPAVAAPVEKPEVARALLDVTMLVMRSVAAEMRRSQEPREPAQMGALMRLSAAPCTITDMARHLNVKPPTVSRLVDMLERRGWVERTASEGDRRRTLIALTAAGRTVLRDMKAQMERHLSQQLSRLSADERDALVAALLRVRAALGECGPSRP